MEESPRRRTVTSSLNEISMYLLRGRGVYPPLPHPFLQKLFWTDFCRRKKDDVNCVSSTSEVFFMLNFTLYETSGYF
jgi:hypothetical protein